MNYGMAREPHYWRNVILTGIGIAVFMALVLIASMG